MTPEKTAQAKAVGRPKIELDEYEISQVEALAAYLSIEKIADYFGMHEVSFHRLKNRDDRILQAYRKGVAKSEVYYGSALGGFAKYEGENLAKLQMKLQAVTFALKTKYKWMEKGQESRETQQLNVGAILKISTRKAKSKDEESHE